MALFFNADTHFGAHRTINIHRRPLVDVAAMDAAIVAGRNEVVRQKDEAWHLGDVARHASLLARLNGVKHLVRGNNDGPGTGDAGWASVQDYAELTEDGLLLVLCHYPFRHCQSNGVAIPHLFSSQSVRSILRFCSAPELLCSRPSAR